MGLDITVFGHTRGINPEALRGVGREELSETLLLWLGIQVSDLNQDSYFGGFYYKGAVVAVAGHQGMDKIVFEWAESLASPAAYSLAALVIRGYWDYAPEIHPPVVEGFLRVLERFPKGSLAVSASIMPLHDIVCKSRVPHGQSEVIRKVLLQHLRDMDRPGAVNVDFTRRLIKELDTINQP